LIETPTAGVNSVLKKSNTGPSLPGCRPVEGNTRRQPGVVSQAE
jgi:hypothetical protein